MPGPNDSDDQLEEGTEGTEEVNEESTDGTESESSEGAAVPENKSDKRISDLQSKFDAETARANKAEKALQKLSADKGDGAGTDPATKALMQELREASLDAIYGDYPELRQYDIDRTLIEGSTRAEMRESATSVVSLIKTVTTKVTNAVLAENGLSADSAGDSRKPPVDYGGMKDDDFLKLLDSM